MVKFKERIRLETWKSRSKALKDAEGHRKQGYLVRTIKENGGWTTFLIGRVGRIKKIIE